MAIDKALKSIKGRNWITPNLIRRIKNKNYIIEISSDYTDTLYGVTYVEKDNPETRGDTFTTLEEALLYVSMDVNGEDQDIDYTKLKLRPFHEVSGVWANGEKKDPTIF